MVSARKRSLLAEFDRAPGDRQSRIALRAVLPGGQPVGPPAAATAAVRINTNRVAAVRINTNRVAAVRINTNRGPSV